MPDQDENFQNTAQYGPLLYLPQAAGIWIEGLLASSRSGRCWWRGLVNALSSTLIAFLAIRLCCRGLALLSQYALAADDGIQSRRCPRCLDHQPVAAGDRARFPRWLRKVVPQNLGICAVCSRRPVATTLGPRRNLRWHTRRALFKASDQLGGQSHPCRLGSILIILWLVLLPKLMPAEPTGASLRSTQRNHPAPLLLPYVLYNYVSRRTPSGCLRRWWVDLAGSITDADWYTWTAAVALLAPGLRPATDLLGLVQPRRPLTFVAILFNSGPRCTQAGRHRQNYDRRSCRAATFCLCFPCWLLTPLMNRGWHRSFHPAGFWSSLPLASMAVLLTQS